MQCAKTWKMIFSIVFVFVFRLNHFASRNFSVIHWNDDAHRFCFLFRNSGVVLCFFLFTIKKTTVTTILSNRHVYTHMHEESTLKFSREKTEWNENKWNVQEHMKNVFTMNLSHWKKDNAHKMIYKFTKLFPMEIISGIAYTVCSNLTTEFFYSFSVHKEKLITIFGSSKSKRFFFSYCSNV